MKKEQIIRLLEHWRRPVPGSDLFRFSHVLVNSKTGVMMCALYEDSLGALSLPQNSRVLPESSGPIDGGTGSDWDAEYNGLRFTPSLADDVNMHPHPNDFDMEDEQTPPGSPKLHLELAAPLMPAQESVPARAWTPVIDPQLIGLQYRPSHISKSIKTLACKVAHLSSHKTGLPFQGYGMVVHKFPTTLDGHENLGWSLDAHTRIGTT